MARNYATNPSLTVQFMNLLEDAGVVKLVGHQEKHVPFSRAMHSYRLSFPFVPDWIVWLGVILSVIIAASKAGII
jgi:hypothetical protein